METIPILTSAGIFSILTLFYGLVKYFMASSYPINDTIVNVIYGFYVIIAIFIQLTININNSKALCDGKSPQIMGTMLHTLVPNLLIFIVVGICIRMFPGWLEPFSNTVGYCYISIFQKTSWLSDLATQDKDEALIKKDNSLFLNELTPTNFTSVITKMLKAKLINFDDDLGKGGIPITKPNSKPMVGGKRRRKRKQKGGDGSKTLESMSWEEEEAVKKKLRAIGINCGYGYEGETSDEAYERNSCWEGHITEYLKAEKAGTLGEFIANFEKKKSKISQEQPSAPPMEEPIVIQAYSPQQQPFQQQPFQQQPFQQQPLQKQPFQQQPFQQQPFQQLAASQTGSLQAPNTAVKTKKGKNKLAGAKEEKLSEEIKANLDKIKFQNLWKLVNIKSVISEVIWFLLCGVLVLAFSYNAILNLSCSHSLEQQEILQKEGDEKLEKLMKEIDES